MIGRIMNFSRYVNFLCSTNEINKTNYAMFRIGRLGETAC